MKKIISAIFLLKIRSNSKINGDSAIAIISVSSLALGVMLISCTTGGNTDIYNYMFGSILAVTETDVIISVILSSVIIFVYVFFYNRIFAVTFDGNFAKATGMKTERYTLLLAVTVAALL